MPADMPLIATDRVTPTAETSATEGRIVWDAPKSLWWFGHLTGAVVAITVFPQWDAVLVFLILTAVTVCAGHSVGMHRLLVHRSFEAPLWLERLLVWLGTLWYGLSDQRFRHPRDSRLAPTPNRLPTPPSPFRRILARRLVATALQVRPVPPAAPGR